MTHAYAESYLNDAMENLGEAFDYAVNANLFGKGVPKVVSGLSGTELVMEVVNKAGTFYSFPKPQVEYDYSPEYWCGWILAYYQWKTGRTFKDIEVNLSVTEILKMYPTLHEASEDKFVDTANAIILRRNNTTRLQRQRKQCGLTQKELSEKSGVKLRTVQQYEMKAKDINKAAVSTVLALSTVLGCRIEDLLEYKVVDDE